MREDEAGRFRVSWRQRPWYKPVSTVAATMSAVVTLAADAASSLAARKNRDRNGDRNGKDDKDRDEERDRKQENNRDGERKQERENGDRSQEGDVEAAASKKQKANKRQEDEQTTEDTDDGGNGGGGGGGGGGGRGDGGGGGDTGNAGSALFDRPLATKTRRRADEFENADREDEEDGIFVDLDPDGESVLESDSILVASGPGGIEVVTDNVTFFAEPPLEPDPLPRLEIPVRDPGYPFGEDFPFGGPTVTTRVTNREPSDPGDSAPAPGRRGTTTAADEPATPSSDGGDNSMDFVS